MTPRYTPVIQTMQAEINTLRLAIEFAQGHCITGRDFEALLRAYDLWDKADPAVRDNISFHINYIWRDGSTLTNTAGLYKVRDDIVRVRLGMLAADLSNAIDRKYLPILEAREAAEQIKEAA